jgi:hypothetical protein
MPKKNRKPVSPEISERELRLRELTDQSLQLLDQLAEARVELEQSRTQAGAVASELDGLRQDIGQLEATQRQLEAALEDSRRRVRVSRSLRDVGQVSATPGSLDVVFWVPHCNELAAEKSAGTVDTQWLTESVVRLTSIQGVSCTLVCSPGLETDSLATIEGLTLVAADHAALGHEFNLAMATTGAELVLIAAVGVVIPDSILTALGCLADESIGLGVPIIDGPDRDPSLGLVEVRDLRLARCPADEIDAELGNCSFPAPEAFVVVRSAFQIIGTFDEDLHGPTVLTDYSLRLQAASYRLRALTDCVVQVPEDFDLVTDASVVRDRMIVIARHRHQDLSAALTRNEAMWNCSAVGSESLLRSLLMHLPGATHEATEVFAQQVQSMVGGSVTDNEVRVQYQRLCDSLQAMHKISCQHVSPRLAEIYEQEQDSVAQDQTGRHRDSWWNSMLERLQLEVETKGALAEAHDVLAGSTQQLAEDLRVRGVQVADLGTQLQGKDAELVDREAQLADREAQLKEFYRRVADRDKRIEDADASSAQQATRLAEISAEVAALQRSLRELDSARGDLAKIVESGGRIVSPDFSVDANSTLQDLSDSIRAISETLAERDRWIVALLGELSSRRLSLRARKLAPHEQDFVDLHGPDAGQSDE